ncbi:hypothetical protein ABK040_011810 [Willaertia magna]
MNNNNHQGTPTRRQSRVNTTLVEKSPSISLNLSEEQFLEELTKLHETILSYGTPKEISETILKKSNSFLELYQQTNLENNLENKNLENNNLENTKKEKLLIESINNLYFTILTQIKNGNEITFFEKFFKLTFHYEFSFLNQETLENSLQENSLQNNSLQNKTLQNYQLLFLTFYFNLTSEILTWGIKYINLFLNGIFSENNNLILNILKYFNKNIKIKINMENKLEELLFKEICNYITIFGSVIHSVDEPTLKMDLMLKLKNNFYLNYFINIFNFENFNNLNTLQNSLQNSLQNDENILKIINDTIFGNIQQVISCFISIFDISGVKIILPNLEIKNNISHLYILGIIIKELNIDDNLEFIYRELILPNLEFILNEITNKENSSIKRQISLLVAINLSKFSNYLYIIKNFFRPTILNLNKNLFLENDISIKEIYYLTLTTFLENYRKEDSLQNNLIIFNEDYNLNFNTNIEINIDELFLNIVNEIKDCKHLFLLSKLMLLLFSLINFLNNPLFITKNRNYYCNVFNDLFKFLFFKYLQDSSLQNTLQNNTLQNEKNYFEINYIDNSKNSIISIIIDTLFDVLEFLKNDIDLEVCQLYLNFTKNKLQLEIDNTCQQQEEYCQHVTNSLQNSLQNVDKTCDKIGDNTCQQQENISLINLLNAFIKNLNRNFIFKNFKEIFPFLFEIISKFITIKKYKESIYHLIGNLSNINIFEFTFLEKIILPNISNDCIINLERFYKEKNLENLENSENKINLEITISEESEIKKNVIIHHNAIWALGRIILNESKNGNVYSLQNSLQENDNTLQKFLQKMTPKLLTIFTQFSKIDFFTTEELIDDIQGYLANISITISYIGILNLDLVISNFSNFGIYFIEHILLDTTSDSDDEKLAIIIFILNCVEYLINHYLIYLNSNNNTINGNHNEMMSEKEGIEKINEMLTDECIVLLENLIISDIFNRIMNSYSCVLAKRVIEKIKIYLITRNRLEEENDEMEDE